jgi:hypothetical protein
MESGFGVQSARANTGLVTVRQSDDDFVRKFEQGIPLGQTMLLEGVGLELDPILTPLLDKRLKKVSGSI